MAANVGNLAIIISGNARPFQNTLANVKNNINQFSAGTQNWITINPPRDASQSLQWGSFGRLIRSALVAGFGGGLAGAMVGVGAMAFGQLLEKAFEVGHKITEFLADSFQEGFKLAKMELGVRFLAGNENRGADWMKSIREMSTASGFNMAELGGAMRILAGNSDDLDNVIPRLRAITEISAGIGADSEQLKRFALAVAQVTAAGRFEAQELNQLTEAGMPIKELASTAGMSVRQFRNEVKAGTVSISVLDETLNRMALSPGGKFFDFLNKQGATAVGQIMRVQNAWLQFRQELGLGIMQGAKDSGWLNAIENGFNFLLENKEAIAGFFDRALEGAKSLAIELARLSGTLIDIASVISDLGKGNDSFDTWRKSMSGEGFDVLAPEAMFGLRSMFGMMDKFKGQSSDIYKQLSMNTGQRLADEVAAAFNRTTPKIQNALDQIRIPRTLASEARTLADELEKAFRKGLTPFDEFTNDLRNIRKAVQFTENGALPPFGDIVKEMERGRLLDQQGRAMGLGEPQNLQQQFAGLFEGRFTDILGGLLQVLQEPRALGFAAADQGIAKGYMELEGHFLKVFDQFPKAMERGSTEAASAISHAVYGSGAMNVQERIAAVMGLAKKAAEDTAKNTKEIAEAVKLWKGNGVKP